MIVALLMIAMACVLVKPDVREINHVSALPGYDIDSLYKAFMVCSKDEGDSGCDSCWQLIMNGKVDDTYWHEH